jgi:hypothetical protein
MTVQQILDLALGRLKGPATCGIFDAVREVQGIIVNRLFLRRSDWLRAEEDVVLTFAAGDNVQRLAFDFIALAGRPYVAGVRALLPLGGMDPSRFTAPGAPLFFEQWGKTLKVYPTPDVTTAVAVPCYYRPPILTDLSDVLPFGGVFDGVFIEGVMGLLAQGLSVVADAAFVAMIQSQVDAVLDAKAISDEQLMADGINGL